MRFASFLSGGFTTMAVINPPESELAKRTSVHGSKIILDHPNNFGRVPIILDGSNSFLVGSKFKLPTGAAQW